MKSILIALCLSCSLLLGGNDVRLRRTLAEHFVFLDIYQGLIPGREEEGTRLLEAALSTSR